VSCGEESLLPASFFYESLLQSLLLYRSLSQVSFHVYRSLSTLCAVEKRACSLKVSFMSLFYRKSLFYRSLSQVSFKVPFTGLFSCILVAFDTLRCGEESLHPASLFFESHLQVFIYAYRSLLQVSLHVHRSLLTLCIVEKRACSLQDSFMSLFYRSRLQVSFHVYRSLWHTALWRREPAPCTYKFHPQVSFDIYMSFSTHSTLRYVDRSLFTCASPIHRSLFKYVCVFKHIPHSADTTHHPIRGPFVGLFSYMLWPYTWASCGPLFMYASLIHRSFSMQVCLFWHVLQTSDTAQHTTHSVKGRLQHLQVAFTGLFYGPFYRFLFMYTGLFWHTVLWGHLQRMQGSFTNFFFINVYLVWHSLHSSDPIPHPIRSVVGLLSHMQDPFTGIFYRSLFMYIGLFWHILHSSDTIHDPTHFVICLLSHMQDSFTIVCNTYVSCDIIRTAQTNTSTCSLLFLFIGLHSHMQDSFTVVCNTYISFHKCMYLLT